VLLITASLTLYGCASLPDQIAPGSRLLNPNTLNTGRLFDHADKSTGWPTATWWQGYADGQLDRLVNQAVAGNPGLKIARARLNKVQALSGVARSPLYPSLRAGTSLEREQFTEQQFIPPPYAGNWSWNNQATLDLSYDLDLWGKNRSVLAASLDAVQVATAEAQEVRLALETLVVRLYVRLSLQYVLLDVAQATLKQRQDIERIVRLRRRAGLANEFELRQAEAPVPAARGEVERMSEGIELLCNQLAALTGRGPGDGEGITRPALSLAIPVRVPASLPAELLGRRPDVVAQRWRVEAASQGIEAAKAAFYPNLNLNAFAGWQSLGFAKFLSPSSFIEGFGPAVTLPIFAGGELRSRLGAATADYDIAVESYNQTLVQALQGVADELVTLRSLKNQRKEADAADDLAARAYAITFKGFQAGLTDYLNVLNAEQQTLTAARHKAEVEARFLDGYAALMQALGGGITVTPPADGAGVGR